MKRKKIIYERVSITITPIYNRTCEILCDMKLYSSKSEICRIAIKQFLDREEEILKKIEEKMFIEIKQQQKWSEDLGDYS